MNSEGNIPSDYFVRKATLVRVIDGDTFRVTVDLGWNVSVVEIDIRPYGINTPEIRGPERLAGLWVANQVRAWFGHEQHATITIHSRVFETGKFGRCLCYVWCRDMCLNDYLLESRYAWPTDKNGSIIGPRDLNRLNLPAKEDLELIYGVSNET